LAKVTNEPAVLLEFTIRWESDERRLRREEVVHDSKLISREFSISLSFEEALIEAVMFERELLINGGFTIDFLLFCALRIRLLALLGQVLDSNGSNSNELTLDKLELRS
jgi:hypothetical protein